MSETLGAGGQDSLGRWIFVTGGTGYLGTRLIPALTGRGHEVRALTRRPRESTPPAGCASVVGDPLDSPTFVQHVSPADTFVHLVGVPRPAPWKGEQFRRVDLPSVQASLIAAGSSGVSHFVYVSVAQPAPVMKAYLQVRSDCEALIRASGLRATILRPWYILGPGHYWPMALLPMYWLMERVGATKESALRLGLVTVEEMIEALVWAIESPAEETRILDVPRIRAISRRHRELASRIP